MANSTAVPHIQDFEDLLQLSLTQLRTLAKSWGVDLSGAKTKDDLEERFIQVWLKHRRPNEPDPPDLAGAFEQHQLVRKKLLEKYRAAEDLHDNFTQKIKTNLEQSHQDVLRTFKDRMESLRTGECTIVIVGEVGAGKSSLLNLILETQIFPSDSLKCTNTIVEIRCSDKKDAIFYFKTKLSDSGERERKPPPKIISLNSLTGIQEFKDCIAECDDSDDNLYDRCELSYPFKTLSKGVVIVDTPGIEGGNNVDQRLQNYLSSAFGFIYVINTNTAGGVQQGRLGHLLKTVVNNCEDFSPEASFFVGNKWEHVPDADKKDVMNDVFYKLNQVYPGIKHDQIHYMSVKKSAEVLMKYRIKLKQHKELLTKVAKLVPSSLRQGMISHYWWLSSILARSSYLLRVTSVQQAMSREELEKQFRGLRRSVDNLQKNTDESIKRLTEKVEFEVYRITKAVQEVLKDREVVNRICNWDETSECPKSDKKKWKTVVDAAAVKISERISHEIDSWERRNGVLKTIDTEILGVFSKELGLMDDQIKELEEFLTTSRNGSMVKTMRVVPVKALFSKKKRKIERTYSTLGGAVSVIGMLDTDKKDVRRAFKKDYDDKSKSEKMAEATVLYLNSILDSKDYAAKLRKFFDRFFKDIDEAVKRIPGFLKADQQLIEALRTSIEEDDRLNEKLPLLLSESSDLRGELDIFYINRIMKFDYELSELDWEHKKELGKGSFAEVFRCRLKTKNIPVALKVSLDDVNQSNVTDILTEDRTMRDLRHRNVVRYYGSSHVRTSASVKFIMVMELCSATLKEIYVLPKNKERKSDGSKCVNKSPGRMDVDDPRRTQAVKYVLDHVCQLLDGLAYIHDKGFTHRDMKLENVLVTHDNVIKITDVGVAKVSNMLTNTLNGSPAYMAPEVLRAHRSHTDKIDMYSFSFMFWEIWFGKDVADEMNQQILGSDFHGDAMSQLKSRVGKEDGGWRPTMSSPKRPPEAIVEMIKRSWSFVPERRPTAKEFRTFLENFLENNI